METKRAHLEYRNLAADGFQSSVRYVRLTTILRYFVIYLALNANAHAIVLGAVDVDNTYSSVGYIVGSLGAFGSAVAIDPNWVLTAAHVVDDPPAFLVFGNPNIGSEAEGLYFFIDEVIIHDDYVVGEVHDDLALIRLSDEDPIVPMPGIVEASFATLSNVDLSGGLPGTAIITGYGITNVDGTLDPFAPILRRYGAAATDPFGPPTPSVDPGFPYDCSSSPSG